MYKLKTIDVWDTLLRRKSHPDFSKLITSRALFLFHKEKLDPQYNDHWALYRERCRVEGEMARSKSQGGEYELTDVLNNLVRRVFQSEIPDSALLAQQLAQLEFDFELRNTYPDPTFRIVSDMYQAEKTLFLSDFYMSAERLKYLLRHHALDDLVVGGISSCDVGCSKHTGILFQHIHAKFDISPKEHVHIGDNFHSDVDVPQRLGVNAIHFEPKDEHLKRKTITNFLNNRPALFEHISKEILDGVNKELVSCGSDVANSAFLMGVRTAPLLVGFVLYAAEQSIIDRIQHLFFFTREGEFFFQVWQKLFPANKLAGLALPASSLLEVSRVATFCASLQEISVHEMMRLWNLYSSQSISALLKSLGLDPSEFVDICRMHHLSVDEVLIYPWQDGRVQNLFQDLYFQRVLIARVKNSRDILLEYLRQKRWGVENASVGIVDIGWRGTIQDNLSLLSPKVQVHGYYLGLQRFLNQQPNNASKSAFGPNANTSSDFSHLLDAVSLIEMLCNSPFGSVHGYVYDAAGRVQAMRTVDPGENHVHHDFVAYFQQGVLMACQYWAEYIDNHVITSSEFRELGCSIWSKLVSNADQDLVNAYASLSHNEVFGVGGFVDKSSVPALGYIFKGVFSKRARQDLILYVRQTQWSSGVWGRRDLGLVHRLTLVLVLQFAKLYKRLRYKVMS